jgi:hypothetical protein
MSDYFTISNMNNIYGDMIRKYVWNTYKEKKDANFI